MNFTLLFSPDGLSSGTSGVLQRSRSRSLPSEACKQAQPHLPLELTLNLQKPIATTEAPHPLSGMRKCGRRNLNVLNRMESFEKKQTFYFLTRG